MAVKSFRCRLITPEAQVLDASATSAVIPAWDGQMGILPDHAPLVAKMGPGELRIEFAPGETRGDQGRGGGRRAYFVEGGFAHMVENQLTLLASGAVAAESLSESDAQAQVTKAQARTTQGVLDEAEVARIRQERVRAEARLRAARNFRSRGGGI